MPTRPTHAPPMIIIIPANVTNRRTCAGAGAVGARRSVNGTLIAVPPVLGNRGPGPAAPSRTPDPSRRLVTSDRPGAAERGLPLAVRLVGLGRDHATLRPRAAPGIT